MSALLWIASQAAAVFAPPTDRPVIVATDTVRTEGGRTQHFVGRRSLRFTATPDGYRVAVTLESTGAADADSDPAGLLRAAFARLAGRVVIVQLDSKGAVIAVEDEAATWQAVVDGIAAMAPVGDTPVARTGAMRVRAVAAALAAQPTAARRAMLGSLVAPLVGVDLLSEAASPAPPRAVRVPAGSVYGKAELDGLRSSRTRPGGIEVAVSAAGPVEMATPEGKVAATMTLETLRRVDPATGLVVESRERVETIGPDGGVLAERMTVTRIDH